MYPVILAESVLQELTGISTIVNQKPARDLCARILIRKGCFDLDMPVGQYSFKLVTSLLQGIPLADQLQVFRLGDVDAPASVGIYAFD